MKIGVLGSGLMGKEAARDLVNSEQVTEVGLADLAFDQAKHVCDQLNSPKLTAYQVDASNDVELADYMRNFDVIINALFILLMKKSLKQRSKSVYHPSTSVAISVILRIKYWA